MFPRNRMFIGLDVSHAGPMSFAERALNMPAKDPSVVGVSAHTLFNKTNNALGVFQHCKNLKPLFVSKKNFCQIRFVLF